MPYPLDHRGVDYTWRKIEVSIPSPFRTAPLSKRAQLLADLPSVVGPLFFLREPGLLLLPNLLT